jgi:hypothetical protein
MNPSSATENGGIIRHQDGIAMVSLGFAKRLNAALGLNNA